MNKYYYFLLLSVGLLMQACGKDKEPVNNGSEEYTINWTAAADSSSNAFVMQYWNGADSYFNFDNAGQKLNLIFPLWVRP